MKLWVKFTVTCLITLGGPVFLWGKPLVIVSIPPQKAFVEAIAGELAEVEVLLRPGQNPVTFAVSPRLLARLGKAEAFFTIGVPMESSILPRLEKTFPDIEVVDTSGGIRKRSLEDHVHAAGSEEGEHKHSEDPHIWLSPGLVKVQLRHYLRTLQGLLPDQRDLLNKNYRDFVEKLEVLDDELAHLLKDFRRFTVFVYHPAFGYFLDRYGLRQETVELQGKQPSPQQLRYLIALAKEHGTKVIFVQPQFNRRSAQMVARAIGGRVEPLDPLAENYLDNLRKMGETIAESYR